MIFTYCILSSYIIISMRYIDYTSTYSSNRPFPFRLYLCHFPSDHIIVRIRSQNLWLPYTICECYLILVLLKMVYVFINLIVGFWVVLLEGLLGINHFHIRHIYHDAILLSYCWWVLKFKAYFIYIWRVVINSGPIDIWT